MRAEENRTELTLLVLLEQLWDLRVTQRFAAVILEQVLLRYVGDILGFVVLRQEVVERLILMRTFVFRDRFPPFLSIRKFRVYIEDESAEGVKPMSYDLADMEFRRSDLSYVARHGGHRLLIFGHDLY